MSSLAMNKDVQNVELQISKSSSERIEEPDYFKQIRDPALWQQTRQGDIKLVDIFKQAKELAEEQAKKETRNAAAEKKYVTTHGNCVGVSGQAGIGKTTLTKQLLEKVLNNELPDVDFLFYVSLKNVNYVKKMGVLQFLLTNLDSSWKHNTASDIDILNQLEESEKVMIIFDGLDEATIEPEKQCPNAKLYEVTTPEVLLKNILKGNILRKAKRLITSRPRQMLELWKECRPHFIVDVLGINREAQRQICESMCNDDSEKVFVELTSHPELVAQCYVPIICIFTIYWLHQKLHHPDRTVAFASITNIILSVLENFAAHDPARNEFELKKLSKLAWDGLRCKKYEFTEREIKQSGLKKESLNTVLTTNTRICLLRVEKITYFSHLILQEFFSGVYLVLFLPLSDFKNVLSVHDEQFGNLDVVKNFIFGLSNSITYGRLIDLQSTLISNNSDLDEKKLFLEEFACKIACKIAEDLFSNNFPKLLGICSMLYEMQDQELTKKVVERFPEELKILRYNNIFPHDVGHLFYVLKKRQKLLQMVINSPTFVGNCSTQFMSQIEDLPKCIKVSVDKFEIEVSDILILTNLKFSM